MHGCERSLDLILPACRLDIIDAYLDQHSSTERINMDVEFSSIMTSDSSTLILLICTHGHSTSSQNEVTYTIKRQYDDCMTHPPIMTVDLNSPTMHVKED